MALSISSKVKDLTLLVMFLIIGYLSFKHFYPDEIKILESESIEIKSLVTEVKRQLTELDKERQSNNELALFQLKEFELELTFVVRKTSSVTAEGSFELIALDASSGQEIQNMQKLNIKWNAIEESEVSEKGDDLDLGEF